MNFRKKLADEQSRAHISLTSELHHVFDISSQTQFCASNQGQRV